MVDIKWTLTRLEPLSSGISFLPHKKCAKVQPQSLLLSRCNDLHTDSPPPPRDPEPAQPKLRHWRPTFATPLRTQLAVDRLRCEAKKERFSLELTRARTALREAKAREAGFQIQGKSRGNAAALHRGRLRQTSTPGFWCIRQLEKLTAFRCRDRMFSCPRLCNRPITELNWRH